MIDNFKQIKDLLDIKSDDDFYYGFICQRRKENPEIGANNYIIKDLYFDNKRSLEDSKDRIIKLCETFNARAYIHLNKRSYKDVSYECLMMLSKNLKEGNYRSNRGLWTTSAGRKHSDKDKKWILDLDVKDKGKIQDIRDVLEKIRPYDIEKVVDVIETKNGYHIITNPFDVKSFNECLDFDIDIHKNNPTILYIN